MAKATAKTKTEPKAKARSKTKPKTKLQTAAGTTAKAKARAAAKRKVARPKQKFTVSHHRDEDFKADGLRNYALYRDLGMAAATNGLVQAHVIRQSRPFKREDVSKRHYHDVEFQMVYVLKGWMKNEFEGHGEQFMRAGSCWIQPSGIKHTVLDYSDDLEVIEIIMPAEFATVEVADRAAARGDVRVRRVS